MSHQQAFKRGSIVHFILSQSYMVFFYAFIIGLLLHLYFKTPFLSKQQPIIGFLLIVVSSLLILWAQRTSHKSKTKMLANNTERNFASGPYKYTRNPTHIGVSFMILGFAILSNSFYILVTLVGAFLITKIFFLSKEEKHLEKIYGDVYRDYKNKVKNWL